MNYAKIVFVSYSVLMSIYIKDNPSFLELAIKSIFSQTLKTDDFVIVHDGNISKETYNVVFKYINLYPTIINYVGYEENKGLGFALNFGLNHCKNEIVLRMDSDDISKPERAEFQIKHLFEDDVDFSSTDVTLFDGKENNIIGRRHVPEDYKGICDFCKTRSPFNHPSIIFKKSKVLECGGYKTLAYKEDHFLWTRMIQSGCKCNNHSIPMVLMRIDMSTFSRRKNLNVYNSSRYLNKYMLKTGFINFATYFKNNLIFIFRQFFPSKIVTKVTLNKWK